jgi:uncharacterized protein YmfQ (DUF2313 family)
MKHAEALKKLTPIDLGAISDMDMMVEGELLDTAEKTIMRLLPEFFPSTTEMLIDMWEAEYDIIPQSGSTVLDRRLALMSKVINTYDLTRAYFTSLAARLGYTIEIIEGGAPFRAGISMAGEPVYNATEMWVWTTKILNANTAPDLEKLFIDLNPPHMRQQFVYTAM